MSEISRRRFIQGSTMAAAAGISGAFCGVAGAAEAQAHFGAPEQWDYEADIVIAGYGAAGIGAAVTASEAGKSVIILEKMDEDNAGGATSCYGGNINPKSKELIDYFAFYTWTEERCQHLAERSAEWADWQCELGMDYVEKESMGLRVRNASNGGIDVYFHMLDYVRALPNVTVMYQTPVVNLVFDGVNKEVLGVVARQGEKEIFVKAHYGVVLATGGYEANKDLVHSLNYPALPYETLAGPSRTGDGMMMANAVGAKIGNIVQNIEWCSFCFKQASADCGMGICVRYPSTTGAVIVNGAGKRFMNEDKLLLHDKGQWAFLDFNGGFTNFVDHGKGYINIPLWAVWSQAQIDTTFVGGSASVELWSQARKGVKWSADNQAEVEKGWLHKADTIEELAEYMVSTNTWGDEVKVDPEALAQTFAEYNADVAAGADSKFGRTKLMSYAEGPYYVAEIVPSILYTINGLVTNGDNQVLDGMDQPIKRLYCAGDIAQGVIYVVVGVVGCMAGGSIAVDHALTLEPLA